MAITEGKTPEAKRRPDAPKGSSMLTIQSPGLRVETSDKAEKGGRGGRTSGAKRSIAIEILGLPLAVSVESAVVNDGLRGWALLSVAESAARNRPPTTGTTRPDGAYALASGPPRPCGSSSGAP